ncbi:MAG: radical SAM protein, partial [Acidobacteriota bacterium]
MRNLLIFPPGWMQFGPYLSLPLLKGFLKARGIETSILDLNLEFYDWVLSRSVLEQVEECLKARERADKSTLSAKEIAKLCKALLNHSYLVEHVESAKNTLRTAELYLDDRQRQQAKIDLCGALNLVESAFPGLTLTLSEISFSNCGLEPDEVIPFLSSNENIIKWFYEDRVCKLLKGETYDFIGFSLPAWEQFVPALTLARALRERQQDSLHLCMGGNYTTRLVGTWGEQAHPYTQLIDSFSLFEGEESLFQLLTALESGQPLDGVSNLAFRRKDKLVRTPLGGVDINAIPVPDFDGLPLDRYFVPEPILPLYTSRSCPWKCSFCTIPYASSKFRQRKAERVAEDLSTLKQKYGIRLFTFVDETLTVPILRNVSREIVARDLDIRWYGETRFHDSINEDLCKQMFQSGCRKIQFGLESYNQRILDLMRKDIKIDYILPNIKACLDAGIAVHLFTFYGFPGEEEAEARQTHEFAQWVLKLSRDTYKNPYSTVGSGTFNLEIYSDVYYHPERYGVTLVNISDPDASPFEINYEVKNGLTRW